MITEEKLGAALGFVLFLLVAVGVHIDSQSAQAHYAGNSAFDAVIFHLLYGCAFAFLAIVAVVIAAIAVIAIMALVIIGIVLAIDRAIKPIESMG